MIRITNKTISASDDSDSITCSKKVVLQGGAKFDGNIHANRGCFINKITDKTIKLQNCDFISINNYSNLNFDCSTTNIDSTNIFNLDIGQITKELPIYTAEGGEWSQVQWSVSETGTISYYNQQGDNITGTTPSGDSPSCSIQRIMLIELEVTTGGSGVHRYYLCSPLTDNFGAWRTAMNITKRSNANDSFHLMSKCVRDGNGYKVFFQLPLYRSEDGNYTIMRFKAWPLPFGL